MPFLAFLSAKNAIKRPKIAARFLPDAGFEPGLPRPKDPRSSALARSAKETSLTTYVEKATYEPRAPHFVGYVPDGSILGGEKVFAKSILGMFQAISSCLRTTFFFDKFRLSRLRFAVLEAGRSVPTAYECTLRPPFGGTMIFSPFVQKHLSKVQFWTLFGFSRFLYSIREAGIFVADAPRCPL